MHTSSTTNTRNFCSPKFYFCMLIKLSSVKFNTRFCLGAWFDYFCVYSQNLQAAEISIAIIISIIYNYYLSTLFRVTELWWFNNHEYFVSWVRATDAALLFLFFINRSIRQNTVLIVQYVINWRNNERNRGRVRKKEKKKGWTGWRWYSLTCMTTLNAWENTLRHDCGLHIAHVHKNPCGSRDFSNQALLFLNCTPISFFADEQWQQQEKVRPVQWEQHLPQEKVVTFY